MTESLLHRMLTLDPAGRAELLNRARAGLDDALGLVFIAAGPEQVTATMTVTAAHLQPFGLVHGGVWCALAESACSVGAAMAALGEGRLAIGVENRTRFVAAARLGAVIRVVAEPVSVSGRSRTWRARMWEGERLCADGVVVVRALDPGHEVGGVGLALLTLEDLG